MYKTSNGIKASSCTRPQTDFNWTEWGKRRNLKERNILWTVHLLTCAGSAIWRDDDKQRVHNLNDADKVVDCAAPIPQPLYIAYYTPTQTSDVHSLFRPWFGKALFFTTWTTTAQELHLFPSLVFLWHFAGNEPIFQACSPMVLIGEFFTAHDGGNQLRIYSRGDCSAEANSGMIIELLKDMVYSYLYNHPSHS